jgi:hypothetical protein
VIQAFVDVPISRNASLTAENMLLGLALPCQAMSWRCRDQRWCE